MCCAVHQRVERTAQRFLYLTRQTHRSKFAEVANKDTAGKDRDDLKTKARVAFNFPAKGRGEEHLAMARQYLTERVKITRSTGSAPLFQAVVQHAVVSVVLTRINLNKVVVVGLGVGLYKVCYMRRRCYSRQLSYPHRS